MRNNSVGINISLSAWIACFLCESASVPPQVTASYNKYKVLRITILYYPFKKCQAILLISPYAKGLAHYQRL